MKTEDTAIFETAFDELEKEGCFKDFAVKAESSQPSVNVNNEQESIYISPLSWKESPRYSAASR